MARFFVEPSRICESKVVLDSRDSHHIAAVLKGRPGDEILVCDGSGSEYLVVLEQVSKALASGKIIDMYRLATEPKSQITVAQALPRTLDKLEWVLQHGTELGATKFIPFWSARSREDWQRLLPKRERWQEIVRSAAEQSRRAICPAVEPIIGFADVVAQTPSFDLTLFAYEGEQNTTLKSALRFKSPMKILVLVGPEGGFAQSEVEAAMASSAVTVSLGPRILRTETAALCLLSQIYFALETP